MIPRGETDIVNGAHALVASVRTLIEEPFYPLTDTEFVEVMSEVETSLRQLETVKHRLIAETERRSLADRNGFKKTSIYLERTLRLSHADALARVRAAEKLSPQITAQGQDVGPQLPYVALAQEEGAISADHARRIAWIINRLPEITTDPERENAERVLTDYAREGSPDVLPGLGEEIMARIDPDGTLTRDKDRQRRRGLTLGKQRVDGMSQLTGEITPELRALLDPLLAKFARPGMCNPEDPDSPCSGVVVDPDPGTRGVVGTDSAIGSTNDVDALRAAAARDTRTAAQRNHDALLTILGFGVDLSELGTHRGVPVAVIITMTLAEVEEAAGVATTASGGTVSISEALKLAQGSRPWLAIFDGAEMPLRLGRGRRLASPAQRLALIAAEKGCTRPGCSAPASMAAVHHVTEYAKDGRADIENLTLACDSCHALIHDGPGGWKTVKLPSDHKFAGRTGWIAPPTVDPSGVPKVNRRHDLRGQLLSGLAKIHARNDVAAQRHRSRWGPLAVSVSSAGE
ncbi:HNH endonuclease signature motif containing protein [Nocardia acidivorans]|uniref:HNH endonuclease signature motif containing protein n=1 Tax=Nocardia acidivorans TaxID=404580 RepID=UPI00082A4DFE|nr:HNH endonuclease signature motif containing protein [Nocardia acidivorans]